MEEPFYYRNKAQFPFGTDKQGHIVTGFYAGRTHQIIPNTECALGVKTEQRNFGNDCGFHEHTSHYNI